MCVYNGSNTKKIKFNWKSVEIKYRKIELTNKESRDNLNEFIRTILQD